jgi:hypothetical protein
VEREHPSLRVVIHGVLGPRKARCKAGVQLAGQASISSRSTLEEPMKGRRDDCVILR